MSETVLTSVANDGSAERLSKMGGGGRFGYSIRIFDTIEEVDPEAWNSILAAEDFLASHRFVRACQRSGLEKAVYRHVLVSRAGQIECIATFCLIRVRLELLAGQTLQFVARTARRIFPQFLETRFLICGLPVSFGQSTLRFRPDSHRAVLLDILDDVMADLAGSLDADILCWKEFSPEESTPLEHLLKRGYLLAPSLPYFRLDVHWHDFEEYMTQMRAGYRRQIRQTLAVRLDSELRIRHVDDYSAMIPLLFDLYEQVMDRAEHQLERLNIRFFRELYEAFEGQTGAILVERQGHLLAFAVLLHDSQATTFLLAGLDYDEYRAHQSYQNLLTAVVAEGIRRGNGRILLGQTSPESKSRFGAVEEPRCIYLKATNRLVQAGLRAGLPYLFPSAEPMNRRVFRKDHPSD